MLIIDQSPLGGRPIKYKKYPLTQDRQGNFGIRLGYLESGDPVVLKLSDAEQFAESFGYTASRFKSLLGSWLSK